MDKVLNTGCKFSGKIFVICSKLVFLSRNQTCILQKRQFAAHLHTLPLQAALLNCWPTDVEETEVTTTKMSSSDIAVR